MTASVPQVSLIPARAKARSRLPQCRVPQPHVWERRGPGAAASAAGGAETVGASQTGPRARLREERGERPMLSLPIGCGP